MLVAAQKLDVVRTDENQDTVESTRIEPFLAENRVILDYLNRENT